MITIKNVCEVKSDYVGNDAEHKLSFYAHIYGNLDCGYCSDNP